MPNELKIALIILGAAVALLFALFLFLTGTKKNRRMNEFKYVKYAHRGLHGEFLGSYSAENSLSAFRKAAELGFGIELDVRLSADGEVVVFHDDTLKRVTGREGRAEDFTAAELAELSLLGTEEGIPTLKSVLECVGGRVPLLVEIKSGSIGQTVVKPTYELLKSYTGPYIVESFNPLSLSAFKALDKNTPRGFLCTKLSENKENRALKYRIIQRHLLNFLSRPSFIAADKEKSKMFPIPLIRFLFRPAFLAWTVKSPEEEMAAYKNGFDGIIFEQYIPEERYNKKDK
jgi:glycerophosphoryl diester phosphodiesterase